jgi:hypothetical protein
VCFLLVAQAVMVFPVQSQALLPIMVVAEVAVMAQRLAKSPLVA